MLGSYLQRHSSSYTQEDSQPSDIKGPASLADVVDDGGEWLLLSAGQSSVILRRGRAKVHLNFQVMLFHLAMISVTPSSRMCVCFFLLPSKQITSEEDDESSWVELNAEKNSSSTKILNFSADSSEIGLFGEGKLY